LQNHLSTELHSRSCSWIQHAFSCCRLKNNDRATSLLQDILENDVPYEQCEPDVAGIALTLCIPALSNVPFAVCSLNDATVARILRRLPNTQFTRYEGLKAACRINDVEMAEVFLNELADVPPDSINYWQTCLALARNHPDGRILLLLKERVARFSPAWKKEINKTDE
jgi:hypothetical protein